MVLIYFFIITQNSNSDSGQKDFTLDSVYYRYQLSPEEISPYDTVYLQTYPDTSKEEGELRISGVKDFSFDLNEGFDQGLKISINGEAQGVKIEGNLSDKATPPATIPISDVDKMSLKLSTTNFYGGLGNLDFDLPLGIHEEIQGGRIGAFSKENRLNLAYAINRGKYQRRQFKGEEGKQSPYFLEGSVIVGSERVELSSGMSKAILLKRDEDYSIDYPQGILSFTNKNIITNNTRIKVEYHQAIEDYQNIFQASDGEIEIGQLQLSGVWLRSYDEKENPLSFTMTEAERESLRKAGDSTALLHTYADTSSQGDYKYEDDHFVWVGEGNGTHRVTFFYMGEGKGEYIYDPIINGFSYQGPGMGNYSEKKFIPLPQENQFYGISIDALKFLNLSLYGSGLDKNTYSPIDDDDNRGVGCKLGLQKHIGIFSLTGRYLYYGDNLFLPMGKEEIDYQYLWNTQEPLRTLGDIEFDVVPWEFLKLNLAYGSLNNKQKRKSITMMPYFLKVGYEKLDTLNRYFADLSNVLGKFMANASYESYCQQNYFNYGLRYKLNKKTNFGITGDYTKDLLGRGITSAFSLSTIPLEFSVGHRLYNDTTFLFGNAVLNITYKKISLRGNLEQSQRYSQKRDEAYIKVAEGKGNYVYDSITNSYIEKANGDYLKRIILLHEFERVISQNYNIEIGYTQGIIDSRGRFDYLNEINFFRHNEDLLFIINKADAEIEFDIRQGITHDSRFALAPAFEQRRGFSLYPEYKKLAVKLDMRENIERSGDIEREIRNDYDTELGYEIFQSPLFRPYVGYLYSTLFSAYFAELHTILQSPKFGLLFGIPIKHRGRIEFGADFIYRIYTPEEVPYFFSATEPPGFTKSLRVSSSFGPGANTIFTLNYSIEFPPEETLNQHLRFQTRIKF